MVEYIDITKEMANERNAQGELVYGESHINCNLFSRQAIETIGEKELPYSAAFKTAKFMDEQGKIQKPDKPNSYKFECFIFDAFEEINSMEILRVKREEEFAPVKNADGEDSPKTAIQLYNEYKKKR